MARQGGKEGRRRLLILCLFNAVLAKYRSRLETIWSWLRSRYWRYVSSPLVPYPLKLRADSEIAYTMP